MEKISNDRRNTGVFAAGVGLTGLAIALTVALLFSRSNLRAQPFDARQALLDARQYLTHQEPGKAEALLNEVLAHDPRDPEAHNTLGEIRLSQGRGIEAYDHFRASLEADPSNADKHFLAGVVATKLGKADESLAHHRRAVELSPQIPKYHLYLGTALLAAGQIGEAQAQAEQARQLDPSVAETYLLIAGVAEQSKDFNRAIAAIDQGVGLLSPPDPRLVRYTIYKASLLRISDRPAQALNLLHELPAPDDQIEDLSAEMAQCYLLLGQPGKAAAAWMELFTHRPHNARAAAEVGLCLLRAGDPRQAARYLGLARAADPAHPSVRILEASLSQATKPAPRAQDAAPAP